MKKPHISSTQINMLLRCPRQYFFRYIEHIKAPPSGAMKQSRAFHLTAERNYRQKIESSQDLPPDELTDFYAQAFEEEMKSEEVVLDEGQTHGGLKDEGVSIVKVHRDKIAPTVQPVAVEEKITLPLTAGDGFAYDLMGVLDLVDVDGRVRDNKAIGKTPNQADLDKDIQLSTYALLYRLWKRRAEAGLRLDAIIKSKSGEPKAKLLDTTRSREGLRLHLNNIGHLARMVAAEAFPMNPTGWWCSPRFCGYWSRCMGKGITTTVDMAANKENGNGTTSTQE